jgi:V/A-type H+-transporting ATPase subunit D
MAIKFQFNKTSLQEMNRQLQTRVRALPTLKNKESALRMEVKKLKADAEVRETMQAEKLGAFGDVMRLWEEFNPSLVQVEEVFVDKKKIAGVLIPVLREVRYKVEPFSLFSSPYWYADGVQALQDLSRIGIEKQVLLRAMALLDKARKKTTQKVNLYEKVQIPAYEAAILKIKRFLEDEENLSKSAQKIVKNRQETEQMRKP